MGPGPKSSFEHWPLWYGGGVIRPQQTLGTPSNYASLVDLSDGQRNIRRLSKNDIIGSDHLAK